MALTKLELTNFTAFKKLDMNFSPGINIIIGENGTGKTHLLKVLYAACDITRGGKEFADKLNAVFNPFEKRIGRLVHREKKSVTATILVQRERATLKAVLTNHAKLPSEVSVSGIKKWGAKNISCSYIPVKEMLAHAEGFRSLYTHREIAFEEIYYDIIDRAFLPKRLGPTGSKRKKLLQHIEEGMDGNVIAKGEVFFLKNKQGDLEFSLLAEGMRKLALIWLLIQNGTLDSGSLLFWDEPESNLNPKKMGYIVEILLELQRLGVQVFLATHDYVILKEFDLRRMPGDKIIFHSLYRNDKRSEVNLKGTGDYLQLHPNMISDTFADLYDRSVSGALSR